MVGLTIGGQNLASFVSEQNPAKPSWMDFGKVIGQMTGNYKVLEFLTGYEGLQQFMFRTPKWPIGGIYFDGILRTEHMSRVRPTTYPVQTGVTMTDHAIIEPAELTIDVMMTDCATDNMMAGAGNSGDFLAFAANNLIGGKAGGIIGQALKIYEMTKNMDYSNFLDLVGGSPVTQAGPGRSVNQWNLLKEMQLSRVPIIVETRLQTYSNMIIEELSAPDDYQTLNALKCTVRLKEIIFANVAETTVSARAACTAAESSGGQTPVQTGEPATTAAYEIKKAGGSVFS